MTEKVLMRIFAFLIPFLFICIASVDAGPPSSEKFKSLKTIQKNRKWLKGNLL
ncbi:MAG: hypothetical protein VYD54_14900 [Bdellovibrionota bacterium]|nr:hypothetical protein [Bdellovibrionota bacterium]